MAEYKGIKGFNVDSLASDPTLVEGQIWYNTTGNALKFQAQVGAWSTGGSLIAGRPAAGSWGTQSAAAVVCGSPRETTTELYNGTAWTEVNNTQTARNYNMAAGSSTAGLCFGGGVGGSPWGTNASEEYDGTSWATGNPMGSQRSIAAGFGTQTAAVQATGGGSTGAPPAPTASEEYDGTSWSAGGTVNTGRTYLKGGGTLTSGIIGPGSLPGTTKTPNVELYNGTAWTETANVNTARGAYGMTKDGANTGALIFCGDKPTSNASIVEEWDGTSWTEVADVTTATQELMGAGTSTAGLKMGGNSQPACEEWTYANAVKTVTVS